MNQSELVQILIDKFTRTDKNNTCRIFINGQWGVGKSFVWRLFEKEIIEGYKSLKPIYISLFGIDTIEMLKGELKMKYLLTKVDEGKLVKSILKSKLANLGFQVLVNRITSKTIDPLDLFNLKLDENYIVCFDDIERTKLQYVDILGVIESVGLTANVLIIGSEVNIGEDFKKSFKEYREKVITREYVLDKISEETLNQIFGNYNTEVRKFKNILVTVFNMYGKNNLRVLNKSIDFINEVYLKTNKLSENLCLLCASLIIEENFGEVNLETQILTEYLPEKVQENFFNRYNIPHGMVELSKSLVNFMKYNIFDKAVFEKFFNPPEKTELDLLLEFIKDGFFKSKKSIEETINKILNYVYNEEWEGFRSTYMLFSVLNYVYYYINKFKISTDINELDRLLKNGIKHFTEFEFRPDLIPLSDFMDFGEFTYIKHLVKYRVQLFTEKRINTLVNDLNVHLSNKNYLECYNVIFNNSYILSDILFIYDELLKPEIDSDYYSMLSSLAKVAFHSEINQTIIEKLKSISGTSNDEQFQLRINKLIGYYETGNNY